MCNILVFIKPDNDHPDPAQDWKRLKAGDVVDIVDEDNFDWGKDVQGPNALGYWRAIVIPNIGKTNYLHLLKSEDIPLQSLQTLSKDEVMHQIREYCVDVNGLKDVMTSEELNYIVVKKSPLFNPEIIG